MPTAAVFFDAGNTLIHLDWAFIADTLARLGHARTADALRSAEYVAKADVDRRFAAADGSTDVARRGSYFETILAALDVPAPVRRTCLAELDVVNRVSCLWKVVEPGTEALLDALRARGYRLAVISNADGRIESDLAANGLGPRFELVVDSHVVGIEKPDPRIFALACDRLGVAPADVLHVGDIFAIDVVGARRAGCDAVLFDPLDRYPGPPDCARIGRLDALLDRLPAR